jgi:hypothetical protein
MVRAAAALAKGASPGGRADVTDKRCQPYLPPAAAPPSCHQAGLERKRNAGPGMLSMSGAGT